jgi:hypothetical protein
VNLGKLAIDTDVILAEDAGAYDCDLKHVP